ncbi:MAG: metallophosphoesterase [Pontiella sp.]
MLAPIPARIGLITDLHFDGGAPASNRLYEKVAVLNAGGVETLVVMGDLVNGTCAEHAQQMLREVSALCETFKGTIYFMPGNHDLDHLSKAEFYTALGHVGHPSRFDFEVGGYRFIGMDCNFSPDGTEYERGNFHWKESAVPEEQLDWLSERLAASVLPVIVISHQRIDKKTKFAVCNHVDVQHVIALSGKVTAVFQGHLHEDDWVQMNGTSYYSLSAHVDNAGPAVLELTPGGVRLIRAFQALEGDE